MSKRVKKNASDKVTRNKNDDDDDRADKLRSKCISLSGGIGIDPEIEQRVFELSQDQFNPVFWYLRKMLFVISSKSTLTTGSVNCSLCDLNNWSEQIAENLPKNKSFIRKLALDHLPDQLLNDPMMSIIRTRYDSIGFNDDVIDDIILGLACYSYFIATEIGAQVSFNNEAFRKIIRTKHLMVFSSLENDTAEDKLFDNVMDPKSTLRGFDLAFMTRRQLLPKMHEKRLQDLMEKQGMEDINIIDPDKMEDGFYECEKCGEKKTTHESRQIRSADEPATIFITCHRCRYVWKEN